jgi:hypothetical protein
MVNLYNYYFYPKEDCGVGAQEKGYLLTSWSALFLMSVSPVGCWSCVSSEFMLYLFVVDVCCWLLGVPVDCQVLNVDCRKLLSVVVSGFWLFSVIG